jgi:NAD(P)-dependent dehydrogenase (short-subunit alcohol dehydrogenase family)
MPDKRIALVTGANQGVGLQVAKELVANGVTVLVGSRNFERGEAAAREIGAGAIALQLDVTDRVSIAEAAQRIREKFGRLDLLIQNAAISNTRKGSLSLPEYAGISRASNASLDEVRTVWETNVFGVLAVYQAMLPLLRESSDARIVNVSSAVGSLASNADPAYPYHPMFGPVYPASKAALNAITLAMMVELESTGIKVNLVSPGFHQNKPQRICRNAVCRRRLPRSGTSGAARPGRPVGYVHPLGKRYDSVVIAERESKMYAITGITGNVGGSIAHNLLAAGRSVRAVVRDIGKGNVWAERGCEVVTADITDATSLASAFKGAEGVFVLVPPNFDPAPGFPEARSTAASLKTALERADPGKVVYLSTIGAQAREANLLTQHTMIEQVLGELAIPITFLRPAWFMENFRWDVAAARDSGIIMSFLQPLDKPFPMVATADIGREAAKLLQESWSGRRVVELEGPRRVTPDEVAITFAEVLGRRVSMDAVPRETWEQLFRSQGMKNPTPRIRMLDGFNDGWIEFENGDGGSRKGEVALKSVLQTLVELEGK